jgi:hypothetical protein
MGSRDIPRVSDLVDPNVRAPLNRVIEEVQRLLGYRGSDEDRAITYATAMRLGWIDSPPTSAGPGAGGGTPGAGGGTVTPDLTPPPTPTGLTVQGAYSHVIVRWDVPAYAAGHGNAQTVIYAVRRSLPVSGLPPVFGDAQVVGTVYGTGTIIAIPSEPNSRWHVWIKWRSLDGVESSSPAGDPLTPNGVQADTSQDVSQLLATLNTQITTSQLAGSLSSTIGLITAADTVPGSVNARIKAEEIARTSADAATLSSAASYVASYTYSQAAISGAIAATASNLRAEFQQADTFIYGNLSVLSSVTATLDGNVRSLYTVRTEVSAGGRILMGGYGLAGTAGGAAGPTIEFGAMVNRFWIGAPAGSGVADTQLFVFQPTPWSDNGVTRPAGAYIESAYIKNLSAVYGTFKSLVADDITAAEIAVAQLTAGSLDVGSYIQSTGFTSGPGGTGFKLGGDGFIELRNAVVHGTIFATAGLFQGQVRVGSSPAISGTTMTGSGAVLNADGTFALGTPSNNITFDGTAVTINGQLVAAGNIIGKIPASKIELGGITVTITGGNIAQTVAPGATFNPASIGSRTAAASGGTAPYSYSWILIGDGYANAASVWINGSPGGATVNVGAQCDSGGDAAANLIVTAKDANGATGTASFRASIISTT